MQDLHRHGVGDLHRRLTGHGPASGRDGDRCTDMTEADGGRRWLLGAVAASWSPLWSPSSWSMWSPTSLVRILAESQNERFGVDQILSQNTAVNVGPWTDADHSSGWASRVLPRHRLLLGECRAVACAAQLPPKSNTVVVADGAH